MRRWNIENEAEDELLNQLNQLINLTAQDQRPNDDYTYHLTWQHITMMLRQKTQGNKLLDGITYLFSPRKSEKMSMNHLWDALQKLYKDGGADLRQLIRTSTNNADLETKLRRQIATRFFTTLQMQIRREANSRPSTPNAQPN